MVDILKDYNIITGVAQTFSLKGQKIAGKSARHSYVILNKDTGGFDSGSRKQRVYFAEITAHVQIALKSNKLDSGQKKALIESYKTIRKGFRKATKDVNWFVKLFIGKKIAQREKDAAIGKALIKEYGKDVALKQDDHLPENLVPTNSNSNVTMLSQVGYEGSGPAIKIPIANCAGLDIKTEVDFTEVCKRINHVTINIPYPAASKASYGNESHFPIKGEKVPRPGHNGTHSARQVRYLEVLLEIIKKEGKNSAALVNMLSAEELAHLKLAVYCLRAGRANDLGWSESKDNFNERSALVYEAYAKQFPSENSQEIISHMKAMIEASSIPLNNLPPALRKKTESGPKALLFYHLSCVVHKLDLLRVKTTENFKSEESEIQQHLSAINPSLESHTGKLIGFAGKALKATGVRNKAKDEPLPTQDDPSQLLFGEASRDGAKCRQFLKELVY